MTKRMSKRLAPGQHSATLDKSELEDIHGSGFELEFHFEYERDIYAPLPAIGEYSGPIPRCGELMLFAGPEGQILDRAGLPLEVWRVQQVLYEFINTSTRRVSVSLTNETGESNEVRVPTLLH